MRISYDFRDLLSLESNPTEESLEIRIGKQGTFVNNLSEWPIRCTEEAISLMERGMISRHVASNNFNEHSSRSHLVTLVKASISTLLYYIILLLMYMQVERLNVRNGQNTVGMLYLVDLAGSERIKLTSATGARLREAQNINK